MTTTTMSRSLTVLGAALIVGATLLFLPSSPARAAVSGAAEFKAKCAACHGADGTGNTAVGKKMKLRDLCMPDVQKLSDAELTTVIAEGKGKMPAYSKKLSPDQIKALVANIRAMATK